MSFSVNQPLSSSMNCLRQQGASQLSQSGKRARPAILGPMLPTFAEQVRSFVDERFALDPVGATIAGVHEHDARLGDFSADGFARREAFAETWLARFEAAPADVAAERTDRELL